MREEVGIALCEKLSLIAYRTIPSRVLRRRYWDPIDFDIRYVIIKALDDSE